MTRQPSPECAEDLKRRGFLLEHWVGGGAYGNVYRAVQSRLGRAVAVKFFDNPFTRGEANRKRFEREAPLLARVEHPSVPYVITSGEVVARQGPKIPYTVMQFINGSPLNTRLQNRGAVESTLLKRVMTDVLGALDAAHKHDVVHRDVKPDNIILSEYATFLIDFSIGIVLHPSQGLTRATETGESVGTWDYAAPEQRADASSVTHLADIFSAGVVLAEMLGARVPLRLDTLNVELRGIPPALLDVVRRAAAEKPDDRYSTAQDFLIELDQAIRHFRDPADTQAEQFDAGRLKDDDVILLGVIASACQLPDSHTSEFHVAKRVESVLPSLSVSIAYRRLFRLGLIEKFPVSASYGDDYTGLRLTEKGELWIEAHEKRASVLLEALKPATTEAPAELIASSPYDDDIPF